MTEQVFRNTRTDAHWNLKFLSVGLAILFAYGFVLHTDAALFQTTSVALFVAQGVVTAAATPFLAIASLRSRQRRLNFNLSRRFVFRSGMLIATGVYLLVMGTAGYYVRLFGGEWGEVVQVLLVVAGLVGLVVVATSTRLRNRLRVTLLRNLYEYKYDYRDEWLRVTRALTDTHADESLARRAVLALGEVVHTTTGRCYRMSGQSILLPMTESTGGLHTPLTPATSASLESFCKVRNWIIDLDEYRTARGAYESLDLDADLPALANDRFIVPLLVEDHLFGIVVLGRPNTPIELIWEDYDILKVIARQAAAFLALQHADAELAASEQLRAMHQISAFVVHDLKTIAAQLSLLLENAPRHRTNPAFIDDMLRTTANAVARMQKLLAQLRDAQATGPGAGCRLDDVASTAIARRVAQLPAPQLAGAACKAEVAADRERLLDVVTHIIQNAQDATPRYGTVTVELGLDRTWATLAVRDSGSGMTREFVEQSLFVPFATTKGVSGIGIGAYQSREYLRSIGGDLTVRTEAGKGSEFVLRIPLLASQRAEPQAAMSASS
jgi:putative PEP-CTERM system histidine kinase